MNSIFYLLATNVLTLGVSLFFGTEFHETAAIIALQLASLGITFSILAIHDVTNLYQALLDVKEKRENE